MPMFWWHNQNVSIYLFLKLFYLILLEIARLQTTDLISESRFPSVSSQ